MYIYIYTCHAAPPAPPALLARHLYKDKRIDNSVSSSEYPFVTEYYVACISRKTTLVVYCHLLAYVVLAHARARLLLVRHEAYGDEQACYATFTGRPRSDHGLTYGHNSLQQCISLYNEICFRVY